MSTSITVGCSIPPESLQSRQYCVRATKIMAACVENSRTGISCDSELPHINKSMYEYVEFSRPSPTDVVSGDMAISHNHDACLPVLLLEEEEEEQTWLKIRFEAQTDVDHEPILRDYLFSTILSHDSLGSALANHLANKLSFSDLPSGVLFDVFYDVLMGDSEVRRAVIEDLKAVEERDPACLSLVHCLLNYKGFLACQAHRVAHKLWSSGRRALALLVQNRVSEVFAVDIHPGARIGHGVLLDHATGVVIGETAVIGNNVSILHSVTLGGTGKASGDRHPKIGDGVLVGAGAHVLGNVRIGHGAKIGAGSVVLKEVPARTTAVGNPARLIGGKENPIKLDKLPCFTMDHTSFISDWSDYVI